MKCIVSPSNNPYYNLAIEEFLIKEKNENYLLFYLNKASIIVGKHQIIVSEINNNFVSENSIQLARRISGGGTVYHDMGNINFSVIKNIDDNRSISYKEIAEPVRKALELFNLEVQFSTRNDLIYNSLKISGSAMHIYKNRAIAHGTILFNSNLTDLSRALQSHRDRYTDKAIKSVRSKVTNISPMLTGISIDTIIKSITREFGNIYGEIVEQEINTVDSAAIEALVDSKYSNSDWIYGYSPNYSYKTELNYKEVSYHLEMKIERSVITHIDLNPNTIESDELTKILSVLLGKKHIANNLVKDREVRTMLVELSLSEINFIDLFF